MAKRRSPSSKAQSDTSALSYTNRMGATYYLHKGKTKTGKPRYFVAKTILQGALSVMGEGYEFSESINGVVSVRRVDTSAPQIPDTDLATVRAELARHEHLGRHRVEAVKGEILVYEPVGGASPDIIEGVARTAHVSPEFLAKQMAWMERKVRYDPVMKFVLAEEPGHYAVYRMTYRGYGGWSWPLSVGPLDKLVRKYLKHVGTEEFFGLM